MSIITKKETEQLMSGFITHLRKFEAEVPFCGSACEDWLKFELFRFLGNCHLIKQKKLTIFPEWKTAYTNRSSQKWNRKKSNYRRIDLVISNPPNGNNWDECCAKIIIELKVFYLGNVKDLKSKTIDLFLQITDTFSDLTDGEITRIGLIFGILRVPKQDEPFNLHKEFRKNFEEKFQTYWNEFFKNRRQISEEKNLTPSKGVYEFFSKPRKMVNIGSNKYILGPVFCKGIFLPK